MYQDIIEIYAAQKNYPKLVEECKKWLSNDKDNPDILLKLSSVFQKALNNNSGRGGWY